MCPQDSEYQPAYEEQFLPMVDFELQLELQSLPGDFRIEYCSPYPVTQPRNPPQHHYIPNTLVTNNVCENQGSANSWESSHRRKGGNNRTGNRGVEPNTLLTDSAGEEVSTLPQALLLL
jgi:hypothetical protein